MFFKHPSSKTKKYLNGLLPACDSRNIWGQATNTKLTMVPELAPWSRVSNSTKYWESDHQSGTWILVSHALTTTFYKRLAMASLDLWWWKQCSCCHGYANLRTTCFRHQHGSLQTAIHSGSLGSAIRFCGQESDAWPVFTDIYHTITLLYPGWTWYRRSLLVLCVFLETLYGLN